MSETITVYGFAKFDRAARVRWLAGELGLALDDRHLDYNAHEQRSESYLALNPFGTVPAAQFRGQALFESGAICQYLVECFPDAGLAPPPGSAERAEYLAWLNFALTSLDERVFQVFYRSVLRPDADARTSALERLLPLLDVLEARLGEREYLVAGRFTLADIVLGHGLVLLKVSKALDRERHPALARYLERLSQRPAAQRCSLFMR